MEKVFLVKDPFHEYAARFIDLIHARHRYRALCYFTDRKRRVYEERKHPLLRSPAVAACVDLGRGDYPRFAAWVKAAYDVIAVVPYNEECVESAAALGAALELAWNDAGVLQRFRDKVAMKAHLRLADPSLRVNESMRAQTPDDAFVRGAPRFARYVLKPNDGYGNRGIGIFDARTSRDTIADFFKSAGGVPLALEEYVDGVEYFVNGQTDAQGVPHVVAVFRYDRVAANGRENIDYRTCLVHTDDPAFAGVAAYAQRVVRATGLVRSPFHLEAKVDEAGPCLIEVGARLPGLRNAFVCNTVHGGALDVFGLAAHYYLSRMDLGPPPVSWSTYDGLDVRYVHGISAGGNRFFDAKVEAEVEALGTFHDWAVRPAVGRRAPTTVDCLSMPWSVVLAGPRGGNLDADEARARSVLARPVSPLSGSVLVAGATRLATRVADRARWRIVRIGSALEAPARDEVRRRLRHRLQNARVGLRYTDTLVELTPTQIATASALLAWARTYLSAPHPELGRKGPICPFVAKTLAENRFFIAVHEEVERSEEQIRDLVLSHARTFRRRYPALGDGSTSLLIALPNVPEEVHRLLDAVHASTKTHLMKRKMMIAAMHPRSAHPAIYNPNFAVLRAPIPCFAIRHMVVQDIAFVGHNREAWLTYDKVFRGLFAAGKVSNELGYVDLYEAARERFRA